ncbi:MAG TPA: PEP-CTERM sorting domain-containing protein [Tepidisphaeraceae bacterium]|nr:PEP-CTERM sorting domain-containing protein [Tepidisphaeraceae bacterium]
MRKALLTLAGIAAMTMPQTTSAAVLTFETAGEYASNFRMITGAASATQSSNGIENDFVGVAGGSSFVSFFDTTPAETTTADSFAGPVTVQTDIRMSGGSFGIYFVNAANSGQGYLAIFNHPGTIRVADSTVPTSNNAGDLTEYGSATGTSGVSSTAFSPLTVSYAVNANNNPVISMTVGSLVLAPTTLNVQAFDAVSVALRISPASSQSISFDNFNVTAVPEPGSLAILSFVGAALATRRRRGTR